MVFPPAHPVAVGVNVTLRSMLCPAASASGRLISGNPNWPSRTKFIAVRVTLLAPVLVSVIS